MLSHEWRELELLCQRISDLRHRYAAAIATSNTGLIEGLKKDLARTKRLRDLVVQHISARLGSAAADPVRAASPADNPTPAAPASAEATAREALGDRWNLPQA